ncbi:sterol desaturase family protein [Roseomonas eburnea]|uniref:Sterol desaturase family protein n=1 Tax=Neoroseomonas eburnea TaxID=1346889 RepID=A0A9X9XKG2_9PROT|nr:sterol desaturase family protein [Neoroseomonas eburnea]MBR0684198.1 sterol desaturase family protein [Neoroseomonas eburnea]
MTWPAYDPLIAAWSWLISLAGILTDPASPFWWPSLAAAVLGIGVAAFAGGRSLREMRREALPRDRAEFWRQLPVDLGFMLVNSALPFLAAPLFFLLTALGATLGVTAMLPVFGAPEHGARLDHPAAMALAAFVAFAFGDFALYWTHRLFHRCPLLWRSHRLHHTPEVLTPITAFRFWPQEQIVHIAGATFMNGLGLGLVATALGGSVQPMSLLGVNAFALAWNLGFSHLRHSHVALPFPRWLSYVLVSPHMHQVHHSVEERHHDRNYATAFAVWDWIFGTLHIPHPQERFRFGVAAQVAGPEPALPVIPR